MRLRQVALIASFGFLACWGIWGSVALGGRETAHLNWRGGGTQTEGPLTVRYPGGWHAASESGSGIVLTSFPVTAQWRVRSSKPLPERGIYMWIFTYGRLERAYEGHYPPRPAQFELDRRTLGFYECGFGAEGYKIVFRENGFGAQVMVALGPRADPEAALAVADRVKVG